LPVMLANGGHCKTRVLQNMQANDRFAQAKSIHQINPTSIFSVQKHAS
jgi:hypothetical protein